VDAFREYDAVFALSRRKYIPPNFAELRHIVNLAQVGTCSSTDLDVHLALYWPGAIACIATTQSSRQPWPLETRTALLAMIICQLRPV
jgi:hypothetical protein